MKKRTAVIGALVASLPMGQPLVIGTGAALTSAAVMLSVPQTVRAESAEFYFNRASRKQDTGDFNGAIEDLTRSIQIDPTVGVSYYNRGNIKGQYLGEYYGAISDFDKAISLGYTDAYNNRGNSKKLIEDYHGAIEDFTKAIELDSTDSFAFYNRGNSKLALKNYYGAISDYNRVLNIDPSNPRISDVYSNLGLAKYKLGDREGACADYKLAIVKGDQELNKWLISNDGLWCRNM